MCLLIDNVHLKINIADGVIKTSYQYYQIRRSLSFFSNSKEWSVSTSFFDIVEIDLSSSIECI